VAVVTPLPSQVSAIGADPAVHWGRLPNGLAYAVLPNTEPKGRVSLRLLVMSGSLQETDAQRGLAHYLEHMAFNGSTHFAPGTLVARMQAMGLGFGNDTNAHTSYDETLYKLDLPDAKEATLETGLDAMADFAGGLLIPPAQVERERGVIQAEMRDRDTPEFRRWQALAAVRYPGLSISRRAPIGVAQTVAAATPDLLRAYYDAWYRPERMVLAVVGDVDPARLVSAIQAHFAAITSRAEQPIQDESKPTFPALVVAHHGDPQADGGSLLVGHTASEPAEPDTQERRRRDLARDVACMVLTRRFDDLVAAAPQGPLVGVAVEWGRWLELLHLDGSARIRDGRFLEAAPILEQEWRRFLRFGPTVTEMDVARAKVQARLDEAVARASTRMSSALASDLVESVKDNSAFLSPAQERAFYQPLLLTLTAEEVRSALAQMTAAGGGILFASGPSDPGPGFDEALRATWERSATQVVQAPVSKVMGVWTYGRDWQPAGDTTVVPVAEVTSAQEKALEVHHFRIGGLPLLVKQTTFKPDEVQVCLHLTPPVGGRPAGVAELVTQGFLAGGLGRHSAQEIRDLMAGSTVMINPPQVGDDGVVLSATCRPQDFELCCERLRACLLDPGWRTDAEAALKTAWLDQLTAANSDVEARVERAFLTHVTADDPARRPATRDEAAAVGFTQARAWFDPVLRSAPLAVTVVGDVNPLAVPSAVARCFALPERPAVSVTEHAGDAPRIAAPVWRPTRINLAVSGAVPRAVLLVAWPTDDFYDVSRTRRLGLLGQAFTERLRQRLREDLGEAYSPIARHQASEAYQGVGWLEVEVSVAPDKMEQARDVVLGIAADLARHGVDEALLAHIKPPIQTLISTLRRGNIYWADRVLLRAAAQPFRLDWAMSMEDDYAAITAADLSALAARYLDNAKAVQVTGLCTGR
jgi:zinc protease